MRQPGKSGLTFDHILSRLQGELQKSRETGAELHNVTSAMSDIHDTLGGTIVWFYFAIISSYKRSFLFFFSSPPTYHHIHKPCLPFNHLNPKNHLQHHQNKIRACQLLR
jgi:hypothetical protein